MQHDLHHVRAGDVGAQLGQIDVGQVERLPIQMGEDRLEVFAVDEPVPFRTTLVTWDLPEERTVTLDELYDAVTRNVDDLMKTLAGPEAA